VLGKGDAVDVGLSGVGAIGSTLVTGAQMPVRALCIRSHGRPELGCAATGGDGAQGRACRHGAAARIATLVTDA
jgi:hypothetical protein